MEEFQSTIMFEVIFTLRLGFHSCQTVQHQAYHMSCQDKHTTMCQFIAPVFSLAILLSILADDHMSDFKYIAILCGSVDLSLVSTHSCKK